MTSPRRLVFDTLTFPAPPRPAEGLTFSAAGGLTSFSNGQRACAWFLWALDPLKDAAAYRVIPFALPALVTDPKDLLLFLVHLCDREPLRAVVDWDPDVAVKVMRGRVTALLVAWLRFAPHCFRAKPELLALLLSLFEARLSKSDLAIIKASGAAREPLPEPLRAPEALPTQDELAVAQWRARIMEAPSAAALADALMTLDQLLYLSLTSESVQASGGVAQVAAHYCRLSKSASSCVLECPDPTAAVAAASRFIEVAALCFNKADFFATLSIAVGLCSYDVSRLAWLKSALSETHRATLAQLEELLLGTGNSFNLRSLEHDAFVAGVSAIPFIPMHLSEISLVKNASDPHQRTFSSIFGVAVAVFSLLQHQPRVELGKAAARSPLCDLWCTAPFLDDARRAALSDALKAAGPQPSERALSFNPRKSLLQHAKQQSKAERVSVLKRLLPSLGSSATSASAVPAAAEVQQQTPIAPLVQQEPPQPQQEPPQAQQEPPQDAHQVRASSLQMEPVKAESEDDSQQVTDDEEAAEHELSSARVVRLQQQLAKRYKVSVSVDLVQGCFVGAEMRAKLCTKRVTQVAQYFVSHARAPIVPFTDAMQTLLRADHVLYVSPTTFVDRKARPVLFMQPARYFPERVAANEPVALLMAFGQYMFARGVQEYVFVADMRAWGLSNFSVSYARQWFFNMQALPMHIAEFILVNPLPFFYKAFKLFSPFLHPIFRAKFRFVQEAELGTLIAHECTPQSLGGSMVCDYDVMCDTVMTCLRESLPVLGVRSYWEAFGNRGSGRYTRSEGEATLHKCSVCNRAETPAMCSECSLPCCESQPCSLVVLLRSLGEANQRRCCMSCIDDMRERIARMKQQPAADTKTN